MADMTKGEALITGLEKVREGLGLITNATDRKDLLKMLVGNAAANRLIDLFVGNKPFERLVLSMVSARNDRLATNTVDKVVRDFLDILFDLSQPYRVEGEDAQ